MLYLSKPEQIYLYAKIVDFRKQINGLGCIVTSEFNQEQLAASWFVFISRDKKTVKLLYWRGSGLAMWQYRLEEARFNLGRPRYNLTKNISWENLSRFLSGLNIFEGEAHAHINPKRLS